MNLKQASAVLCMASMLAGGAALAAPPATVLSVQTMVDVTKEMSVTDAVVGFYDHNGVLVSSCKTSADTDFVSDSQSHWIVNPGAGDWQCVQTGLADGDGLVVLASQEHSEVWSTVAVGNDLILYTPGGVKAGGILAFDIDGEEPTWFDIDGEEPTWITDPGKAKDFLIFATAELIGS